MEYFARCPKEANCGLHAERLFDESAGIAGSVIDLPQNGEYSAGRSGNYFDVFLRGVDWQSECFRKRRGNEDHAESNVRRYDGFSERVKRNRALNLRYRTQEGYHFKT